MDAFSVGTIVSYQGRCWMVTKTFGIMLHLVTPTAQNRYHAITLPRNHVTTDLRSTEGNGKVEMYCPLKGASR